MSPLLKYARNIHSQNGEDGVLSEILRRLNIQSGWFCEFGAWDGMYLSNTYALAEKGWRGVEIEGDTTRFLDLTRTCEALPTETLYPICSFVSHDDRSRMLDTLLATTPIPADFDVLSIDIDSTDYQIWDSLINYRPKIVIIEIDSSIPPGDQKVATAENPCTSFTPMVELGRRKGYTAVCHTGNIIFVRGDLYPNLKLPVWVARHAEKLFLYRWVKLNNLGVFVKRVAQRTKRVVVQFEELMGAQQRNRRGSAQQGPETRR